MTRFSTVLIFALALPVAVFSQHAGHAPDMAHVADAPVLREPGQGAFAALKRMVPAHAAQVATATRWRVVAREPGDRVEMIVTSDDTVTTRRIRALGVFGLMASQDHHRAHNLAIARGMAPDGHRAGCARDAASISCSP